MARIDTESNLTIAGIAEEMDARFGEFISTDDALEDMLQDYMVTQLGMDPVAESSDEEEDWLTVQSQLLDEVGFELAMRILRRYQQAMKETGRSGNEMRMTP